MTEKDITYDRNGNVTGLKRYMTNGMRDELVFTHAGNLVTQWTDVYNTDNGYYDYDGNGNRIQDGHSNLDYSYNILNLPERVSNAMNQHVTYKYLADGTKISALSEEGEGKEYRGTFIYDRHSAEGSDWTELGSIAWEEGRIVVKPGNDMVDSLAVDSLYVEDFPIEGEEIVVDSIAVVPFYLHDLWYVKDHLGSVRSVVLLGEDYSGTAALVEQNGYYPFGTRIAGTAGAAADSLDYANRYRFCGKEEQDFSPSLNLKLLDFGARHYDPFTCCWTTQDPLAEKYYSLSPYNYCAGNPENLVDPNGMVLVPKGNQPFNKKVYAAINHMYAHEIGAVVDYLSNAKQEYFIVPGKVNSYNRRTRTITWNPDYMKLDETGTIMRSSTVSLAHELGHAENHDRNEEKYLADSTTEDMDYVTVEEKNVIEGIEQDTARALGEISVEEVTRTSHDGRFGPNVANLSPKSQSNKAFMFNHPLIKIPETTFALPSLTN